MLCENRDDLFTRGWLCHVLVTRFYLYVQIIGSISTMYVYQSISKIKPGDAFHSLHSTRSGK